MKKKYLFTVCTLLLSQLFWAQTTEAFEAATTNAVTFTSNSQVFNITSTSTDPYKIVNSLGWGWSGTVADNKYIDNSAGPVGTGNGSNMTIKSAGSTAFTVKSLYIYIATTAISAVIPSTCSATYVGKKAGSVVYTITKNSGYGDPNNVSVNNGFTLIDFATEGGTNNSNLLIDELVITAAGNGDYMALDAFRWQLAPSCTAPVVTTSPLNKSICNGGNTTFSLTATGATAYQWQVNSGGGFTDITNGGVYSNATTSTLTITGATSGVSGFLYRCVAKDGSCSTTSSSGLLSVATITLTSASQTNIACNAGSTGAATVNAATGGTGPYTYDWTPGNPTGDGTTSVSGLTVGTWTCTVTDANGCTKAQNFTVTQPTAITVTPASQTNVACNGGSNGAASINTPTGGAGGFTYNWTPGNPTGDGTTSVTGLTAGTWTCTVTDANGCNVTQSFTITQPAALDNSITQLSGVLTATQTGVNYQWYQCPNTILTGKTTQSFTPTNLGDYKVNITLGSCTVTSICATISNLGTSDFETKSKFLIYPNPNTGIVNIKSGIDGDFQILNQMGQTVKTFKVNANIVNTINVEHLINGIYFVKNTNQAKSYKLIIKK
jgi:hypothetical protein